MLETLYTVEETANILKIHPVTLTRYLREGQIKAYRIGRGKNRTYRISASAVQAYLEEQEKPQELEG